MNRYAQIASRITSREVTGAKNLTGSFEFSGSQKGTYVHYGYGEVDNAKKSEQLGLRIKREIESRLRKETGMTWNVDAVVDFRVVGEKEKPGFKLWSENQESWHSGYEADFRVTCSWVQIVPEEADLVRRVRGLIAAALK